MPKSADSTVELMLEDGRRVYAHRMIADRVRGIDADGDLVLPLGEPGSPIRHEDGAKYLIALTPCCHASGKGAASSTGVICRACYREVDGKYGGPSTVAVRVIGS